MDKLKQEQDRIARLQSENHAALKAAQEGTEADGWQTLERTPERQNMTEREAIVDAWGNEGEDETCLTCDGSGVEYDETCVTCGGLGFTCWPADSGDHLTPERNSDEQ